MEKPGITIAGPKPYQVVQRHGFQAKYAHENHPGGPKLGEGRVAVAGVMAGLDAPGVLEARTVLLHEAYGRPVDWTVIEASRDGEAFAAVLNVPAGGWYRLELRYTVDNGTIHQASVEPVGVGELFLVAGQSYAENCNDEYTFVEDREGRITAFDSASQQWRTAHDPQPAVVRRSIHDSPFKGSIWPLTMNLLLPVVRVPIGMANVAVGGTAIRRWLPGENLFDHLLQAGRDVHDFRCVLWQQGESDVIEATSTDTYKERLTAIKNALDQEWGKPSLWLLAKSTLHPTVYHEPEREGRIRQAIDELCGTAGFLPGPDTDLLGGMGVHRAKSGSRHFTLLGQQRAALLWFAALWNMLILVSEDR